MRKSSGCRRWSAKIDTISSSQRQGPRVVTDGLYFEDILKIAVQWLTSLATVSIGIGMYA
jgi:hypothetical protein